MGLDFDYIQGQTPLDEDEKDGLLIPSVINRNQLDEFEQRNIEEALIWIQKRKLNSEAILSIAFICDIHKKMYGDVWTWAGKFRKSNKNIGVDKWQIAVELKKLLDDTKFWIKNNTFNDDEIAIRFKHRLVSIHCFSNGNGRHSRLMADILIEKHFKKPVFTWGGKNLVQTSDYRIKYLNAVRKADLGEFEPLLNFSRD